MVTDTVLLRRYARNGDADAFAELTRRYSRMVYNTCLRVTGNSSDAEDAAQESFLELARRPGAGHKSLPAWLHQVARSRAINVIRRDSTRRRCEEEAMRDAHSGDATWSQISPLIDEALEGLPSDVRTALILYFLEGYSQTEVAERLGISQSSVSRSLDSGIESIRKQLQKVGLAITAAALGAMLLAQTPAPVPQSLSSSLGKMAMAGLRAVRPTRSPWAGIVTAGLLGTLIGKLLVVSVLLGAVAVAWRLADSRGSSTTQTNTLEQVAYTPTGRDCRERLEERRVEIRDYHAKYGKYPLEMYDYRTIPSVPGGCMCPVDHDGDGHTRIYIYDVKNYPDRLVVCTTPGHEDY